jgi:hypothetical protein
MNTMKKIKKIKVLIESMVQGSEKKKIPYLSQDFPLN